MFPGMGRGMNPRQMKMMMKKAGLSMDELDSVEEVIIKTATEILTFTAPEVSIMNVQGQKTYQVNGEPDVTPRDDVDQSETLEIPEEDIELVAIQANVDPEVARQTLIECNGNPAEAIIKLSQA